MITFNLVLPNINNSNSNTSTNNNTNKILISSSENLFMLKIHCLEYTNELIEDAKDFEIYLDSYGIFTNQETDKEMPILAYNLIENKEYIIRLILLKENNINSTNNANTNPITFIGNICTRILFKNKILTQPGIVIEKNKIICLACAYNKCSNGNIVNTENKGNTGNNKIEESFITVNKFLCLCEYTDNNKCCFSIKPITGITNTINNLNTTNNPNTTNILNIPSYISAYIHKHILKYNTNFQYKEILIKKNEAITKHHSRSFDFDKSIQHGMNKIQAYDSDKTKANIDILVKENDLTNKLTIKAEKIYKEKNLIENESNEISLKDAFVMSLLDWFKNSFFSWCNSPICGNCKSSSNNKYNCSIKPSNEEAEGLASRTEIYECTNTSCSNLGITSRFPRYNCISTLIKTKTGRCGEWANTFGAFLNYYKYETRFIDNFEDHVWNEYYSEYLQRWIHVDSCEKAWDKPLTYEQGWGREMVYILGYSKYGVYDVTPRYVLEYKNKIELYRKKEDSLILNNLQEYYNNKHREKYLEYIDIILNRDALEKEELSYYVDIGKKRLDKMNEQEKKGRQSGSEEWRKNRGEIK